MSIRSSSLRPYIIAVDIGTTSTKTLVINREGQIMASHSIGYPLYTPRSDIAEQDPDTIFQAVVDAIGSVVQQAGLSGSDVLCVSFSSAMHSLIAIDQQGMPLTNCITWADNRSATQSQRLRTELDGHAIYLATGTPIHPMSPLPKLMWLRENEPALFARTYKFIGIKEYVFAKLFNRYVIDYSLASATGLFNLRNLAWHEPSLELAGVSAEQLSEPVSTTYRLEGMNPQYAVAMGLWLDTPFVVGASDGVLANLGAGAVDPGVYNVTIGTSGAIRGVVRKPLTDPKGRLFCYALDENFWVVGGAINNGGIMFRWVRDELATLEAEEGRRQGRDPYDYLTELAESVPAGSDGLLFLPLLAGERAPYYDSNARGVFFGLSLAHHKKQMIRAVLEGVVYRIHSIVQALSELNGEPHEIRASGGFARSPLWRQIMADVLGTPVSVPNTIESSGLGAAILGLYAMGEIPNYNAIHDWVSTSSKHDVNADHFAIYQELTPIYQRVYHQLKHEFRDIAAFQQRHAK